MRHASIEPGRMVASEYRLPLTRCLALADLTQEKRYGRLFLFCGFWYQPPGKSLPGHSEAFFGQVEREPVPKKDPKESRPLMLRHSQWEALRELAKAHGCAPGDIVGALIEVHLRNFAPKLDVHLARLKGVKPQGRGQLRITPCYVTFSQRVAMER